ncbi:MAG: Gfo/Idh/MocA family oxidoreductase [Chloroflexi bacterium]|nr:Gfo/Idh/MocA family oxidoreductase [Chloroflexota bacterium]
MTRILYLYTEETTHRGKAGGADLAAWLAAEAGSAVELVCTSDLDALIGLPGGGYEAVVINTHGGADDLTPERERGLLDFVAGGGGCVGIHAAAVSGRNSRPYVDMLNGAYASYEPVQEFAVAIQDREHYLTVRMPDFRITDEIYHLRDFDPARCRLLATTHWLGQQLPLVYVREHGRGRLAYIALGHGEAAWRHPEFKKLVLRAIRWSRGAELSDRVLRWGVIGYSGMAKAHIGWVTKTPGMQMVGMCDINPACVEQAQGEHPEAGCYDCLDDLLAREDLDVVTAVVPHSDHEPVAVRSLRAGKHVVVEKPFSCTVAEADSMIRTARETGKTLSVFHQRRWDGDYVLIRDLMQRGLLGDVFHIEAFIGGYDRLGPEWRNVKAKCGSNMHDWGAHFLDWILGIAGGKVVQVFGDFQKRLWKHVTIEDYSQANIRFDNGVSASFTISSLAALPRPKWYIMGTKGTLRTDYDSWDHLRMVTYASGAKQECLLNVENKDFQGQHYYRYLADHLLMGEEVPVTPESARRVIAIIEAALRSSELGVSQPVAPGCE